MSAQRHSGEVSMIYLVKESDCWIKKSATQGSAQVCN